MSGLSIGLTGMQASQQMLDLVGQNISNASTPGYHREVGTLTPLVFGSSTGDGVEVGQVQRVVSDALEASITSNTSDTADSTRQLQSLSLIQGYFTSSTGNTLQDQLSTFFNDAQQLSVKPDDVTQRRVVLEDASQLATGLNDVSSQFDTLSSQLRDDGNQVVAQINGYATQVAALNSQIAFATNSNLPTATLEDQRDAVINQIAGLASVRVTDGGDGQKGVSIDGVPIVAQGQTTALQLNVDASNNLVLNAQDVSGSVNPGSGQLGALLSLRNTTIPQYQTQFNTFAQTIVTALDGVQATGIGLNGPMTTLTGTRPVSNVTVPLDKAGLTFPPQKGSLFVSVTNQTTGQRTTHQVNIDPSTESLQDIATSLSAVPGLQATTDPQTGQLTVLAQNGYAFDFAGQLSSSPDTQAITGTATPAISGAYTGTSNDAFTYTVAGSGTVGVSSNLSLQVRNSAGALLDTYNIGQGYSPGANLGPQQGVTVAVQAGTLNAGDTFSVQAIAQPDTANLTTALGLNTLFTGGSAHDLAVNPDLLANPQDFALSSTGDPGDGSNLQKLVGVQDETLFTSGTQTASDYLGGLVGQVATQVSELSQQQTAQQNLGTQLTSQQQNVSGVDPNEELVMMLQYQRGFQLSAQFISTVNTTYDDLMKMI